MFPRAEEGSLGSENGISGKHIKKQKSLDSGFPQLILRCTAETRGTAVIVSAAGCQDLEVGSLEWEICIFEYHQSYHLRSFLCQLPRRHRCSFLCCKRTLLSACCNVKLDSTAMEHRCNKGWWTRTHIQRPKSYQEAEDMHCELPRLQMWRLQLRLTLVPM